MSKFKTGEMRVDTGSTILTEGTNSPHLYTILSGWAFRYKTLEDGRRQILNYAMPGDLVGLQSALMENVQHSVEALSPMVLCVFNRNRLDELFRNFPSLAYDITWLASREERMLDEHLLSIGQRSAAERAAYLLAFLYERARSVGLVRANGPIGEITQQHIADTLGLSSVHTNRTLRKLVAAKLIRWSERAYEILDLDRLCQLADWQGLAIDRPRPLI